MALGPHADLTLYVTVDARKIRRRAKWAMRAYRLTQYAFRKLSEAIESVPVKATSA